MKLLKSILFSFIIIAFTYSCNNKEAKNSTINTSKVVKTPNYEKMEFHIKGMTCEIGCARLIESKLSKTKGVKFSKVSFKDSLGMVEYDTNLLSKKDINNVVDKIADGTLYKASNNKIVNDFKIIK